MGRQRNPSQWFESRPTQTPALQKLGLSGSEQEHLAEQIRQLVPIKRMGTSSEIAHAAVFLASDESSFVVGTELRVDGGSAAFNYLI